ncbi:hypothetical protein DVH05_006618 [Phytophthora capsici]|nr:hypothetical protein DVH05_006618 [Phytophthora capsici]
MQMSYESKAYVEKQRLDFDREKWPSETQQSDKHALERDHLAFEKSKWEKERDDRPSELKQEE